MCRPGLSLQCSAQGHALAPARTSGLRVGTARVGGRNRTLLLQQPGGGGRENLPS